VGTKTSKLLIVFGNEELMFTKMNKEVPLPIPFSVINSLNHKIITEPVVNKIAI
jgi:hypothetical protein